MVQPEILLYNQLRLVVYRGPPCPHQPLPWIKSTPKDCQVCKSLARWFFVTFLPPSWRSLNLSKRSLNHPKKVTLNHLVVIQGFSNFLGQSFKWWNGGVCPDMQSDQKVSPRGFSTHPSKRCLFSRQIFRRVGLVGTGCCFERLCLMGNQPFFKGAPSQAASSPHFDGGDKSLLWPGSIKGTNDFKVNVVSQPQKRGPKSFHWFQHFIFAYQMLHYLPRDWQPRSPLENEIPSSKSAGAGWWIFVKGQSQIIWIYLNYIMIIMCFHDFSWIPWFFRWISFGSTPSIYLPTQDANARRFSSCDSRTLRSCLAHHPFVVPSHPHPRWEVYPPWN